MPDRKNIIFALVSAAIFMDMMVYTLVIPVLPSYATKLGADTVAIGIIYGAFSVSLLLFSIPFGILSDRLGRRSFMMLGMLSLAATNVLFALSADVRVLIAARLLQGMSGAATWSAGLAMLADTFGQEERGGRLGLAMSAMSAGTLLGPVVGGILYDNLGYALTFAIPSALACIVGLAFLLVSEPAARVISAPFHQRLTPYLKAPRIFLAITLAVVVGAATYGVLEPFMPVYMYDIFSATPTMVGLAFGAMSLLSIVFQPVVGRLYDLRVGRLLIAAGMLVSALVVAGCVSMPSFFLTAAVFSLLGITMCFALTPMLPLISDLYGGDGRGSSLGMVYGIYNTLFSLGLALGPFAGGLIAARYGFPFTAYAQAALLAIAGFITFLALRPHAR
ncbi:MAG TPA: MFS transporter [Methanocella sp.]|uniref:MFS transporter n=1 Tax=Methanocella sp. TaxID=2052833 RepID=UPI002C69DEF5|nr:MFS transporter [Methanocella sp.]HTY92127.1 MFS transporter [Methanocella sp.]